MSSDTRTGSRYRTLVVPEFKSTIPVHFLARLPESERHLIDVVSKVEQYNAWIIQELNRLNESIIELDEERIELDVRLDRIERLIERLTNKWSVITYIVVLSLPIAVKIGVERLLKP